MDRFFKNITTFNAQGRVRRRDLLVLMFAAPLLYMLIFFIATLILGPFAESIGADALSTIILILVLVLMVHYSVISLLMYIKRLHDSGKSGAYYFITLIPIIGPFILLYFLFSTPDIGPNIYGEDPRQI
jgi:uncharacterized membrane protein YhaH (DUF805 family)